MNKELSFKLNKDEKLIQLTTDYWVNYNEYLFEVKFNNKQRKDYLDYISNEVISVKDYYNKFIKNDKKII